MAIDPGLDDLVRRVEALERRGQGLEAASPANPNQFILPKSIDSALLKNVYEGTGTPEGAVYAVKGAIYQRLDGGAATCLYVKETSTGNTGWVAK